MVGGILRHDTFFGTGDVFGGIFSDRIFGDDDATGMHGGVPGEASIFGNVDEAFGIRIPIIERFEIGCLLKRFFPLNETAGMSLGRCRRGCRKVRGAAGIANRGAPPWFRR